MLIKTLLQYAYKYVLPLTCTLLFIFKWPVFDAHEARTLMSLIVILFIRVENCFAPYRFYVRKSAFEYEITVFLATVKIVNLFQVRNPPNLIICQWAFDLFLLSNIICYTLSFAIIIVFVLIVVCGLLRGDQQFILVGRGLTDEDLLKLKRQVWHLYNEQQGIDCPICLGELLPDDEVVQLPKCNHYFHGECIDDWLKIRPQCPSCRNNVKVALLAN